MLTYSHSQSKSDPDLPRVKLIFPIQNQVLMVMIIFMNIFSQEKVIAQTTNQSGCTPSFYFYHHYYFFLYLPHHHHPHPHHHGEEGLENNFSQNASLFDFTSRHHHHHHHHHHHYHNQTQDKNSHFFSTHHHHHHPHHYRYIGNLKTLRFTHHNNINESHHHHPHHHHHHHHHNQSNSRDYMDDFIQKVANELKRQVKINYANDDENDEDGGGSSSGSSYLKINFTRRRTVSRKRSINGSKKHGEKKKRRKIKSKKRLKIDGEDRKKNIFIKMNRGKEEKKIQKVHNNWRLSRDNTYGIFGNRNSPQNAPENFKLSSAETMESCPTKTEWIRMLSSVDSNGNKVEISPGNPRFYVRNCQFGTERAGRLCSDCCYGIDHSKLQSRCAQQFSWVTAQAKRPRESKFTLTTVKVNSSCACNLYAKDEL